MSLTLDNLDETQRLAVNRAIDTSRRCAAVTGEAGTGKTTIMRFVVEALRDAGYNPGVASPTGKAARRVREATGLHCETIHMMLEYGMPREFDKRTGRAIDPTQPRRTRENPLSYDTIVVDEYAMVNRELHANLVAAMPPGARLITFGDIMQLPPIETSSVIARQPTAFKQLIDKFDGVYLTTNHRQNDGSAIRVAAHRVLRGLPPADGNDFKRIITEAPVDAVVEQLDKADYRSLSNHNITPANKSWIGTHKLNAVLQRMLMPDDRETIAPDRHEWDRKHPIRLGVGDKVVMCKNWYSIRCEDGSEGVFNGETGIITDISELHEITIDFEDRVAVIPPMLSFEIAGKPVVGFPHKDLQLAYALTTHKCQGSEFQHVTYVIGKAVFPMLNRKNLYTAITRARAHCTLIGDMRALSTSLYVTEPKVFGE